MLPTTDETKPSTSTAPCMVLMAAANVMTAAATGVNEGREEWMPEAAVDERLPRLRRHQRARLVQRSEAVLLDRVDVVAALEQGARAVSIASFRGLFS